LLEEAYDKAKRRKPSFTGGKNMAMQVSLMTHAAGMLRVSSSMSYTVNRILRCIRGAARRNCPERWARNSWFLLHGNAYAHLLMVAERYLGKHIVTALKHPPYFRVSINSGTGAAICKAVVIARCNRR
jgi:hypothetical protein